MDNLNPLLIAIVPALLTYLGTKYKSQNERELQASSEWRNLYREQEKRMDDMQAELSSLKDQIAELKRNHKTEVTELKSQNAELREENRQLRVENGRLENQLISLGGMKDEEN